MFLKSAAEPNAKPPRIEDDAILITSVSLNSNFLNTSRTSFGCFINELGIFIPCFLEIRPNAVITPAVLPATEAVFVNVFFLFLLKLY